MIMNKEYDYIEFARYAFETEVESKSYFCYDHPSDAEKWNYEECFHCGHCDCSYAIKDLTIKIKLYNVNVEKRLLYLI